MKLITFENFQDFELIDSGNGFRLEKWNNIILKRPDPQSLWQPSLPESIWQKANAEFTSNTEKGRWNIKTKVPKKWEVNFRPDIKLVAKLTPFKHTGIFAEQAAHWEWLMSLTQNQQPLKILNLFAYTGGATVVLTRLGHHVTHVDASKPSIAWAKENQAANKFTPESIRWILDDALKFAERELKRGAQYDGIIMDPPAFGHSPTGKTWKFNKDFPKLLETCIQLLSAEAKFLLVNAYATNISAIALGNILEDKTSKLNGNLEYGELCLKQKSGRLLSTGVFARWQN